MNTIGIDIGSTFMKAAVLSTQTHTALFRRSLPAFGRQENPVPEIFELPAEEIFTAVESLIAEAAAKYPLSGILLSTQMHGFVYRPDGGTGPDFYVSWQDCACTLPLGPGAPSALETLRAILPPAEMEPCGVALKPSLGLCNLYARLFSAASPLPRSGELFTLGSWLIWRLTGQNVCHLSNAAPLGLTRVREGCWNHALLEKLGLSSLRLPRIARGDFECCGQYHAAGQTIPVFPDYGDQQVSILGSEPALGDVVVNIATASQVSCNTPDFLPGPYEIRPYFQGLYLNTISNMPGGRNLAVITDFVAQCAALFTGEPPCAGAVWEALGKLSPHPDSQGLAADTLFYPTQDRLDGGSITGIRPYNLTLGNLLTALYRNMAQVYAQHIPLLFPHGKPQRLVFSGGVSWKNPALLAAAAGELALPYLLSPIPDEAFNGLYRLSLGACGIISHLEEDSENRLSL